MKKTIAIATTSAVFVTLVVATIIGGRISGVSYVDNYRNIMERNYEDCMSAMQFGSDESVAAQPQWCKKWWNKLSVSEKMPIGFQSENSYPAEQDVVKP